MNSLPCLRQSRIRCWAYAGVDSFNVITWPARIEHRVRDAVAIGQPGDIARAGSSAGGYQP
jgi:hypothetical protein